MRYRLLVGMALLLTCAGCVERRLLIRSRPPGAPVWVDEEYVGESPVDWPFAHYGTRRIRVGPLRGETGKVEYLEQERFVSVRTPWYEIFPIDFFFEVLWPGQLMDRHVPEVFELEPAPSPAAVSGEEVLDRLLDRADRFRQRALSPVPDEQGEQ